MIITVSGGKKSMNATRREQLLSLLQERAHDIQELATILDVSEKTVEKDLFHLQKSLRHDRKLRLYVLPARCSRNRPSGA